MSTTINLANTPENEDTMQDEDAFLAEKLKGMTFSPRIEQLFEKRRKAASMVD